jgi:outer membrane PBP1 activator LpoA protein
MKTLLACSAIAAALLLSACASAPSATTTSASASVAQKSGTMYCHKERLYQASGELVCNWSASAAEVCRDNVQSSRIAVSSAVAAPADGSRCASGQWLVQVALK